MKKIFALTLAVFVLAGCGLFTGDVQDPATGELIPTPQEAALRQALKDLQDGDAEGLSGLTVTGLITGAAAVIAAAVEAARRRRNALKAKEAETTK